MRRTFFCIPAKTGSDGIRRHPIQCWSDGTGLPFRNDSRRIPEAIENGVMESWSPRRIMKALSQRLALKRCRSTSPGDWLETGQVEPEIRSAKPESAAQEFIWEMIGRSGSPEPPANASRSDRLTQSPARFPTDQKKPSIVFHP